MSVVIKTLLDKRRTIPPDLRFLVAVVPAILVAVITGNMVNVVLPTMREDFGASVTQVGWVVTGFMLVMAIAVPLYGRISDFFGLRRVFSLALVVFALGGLISALAPSLPVLVLGRVVQAAGDAAVPALAFVAVAKILPPGKRGGAMVLIASAEGIGLASGLIVGGVIGGLLGWRILFLGTLVVMVGLIPVALRVLPDGGSKGEKSFDLTGGILLGLAAALFLFGITQGQSAGFGSLSSWGSFLGAAFATVLFTYRIASVPDPFVSPKLFGNREYAAAVLVRLLSNLALVSMFVSVPLLVVEVNGLSAAAAGLILAPGAIAQAVISPLAGRLSDRIGPKVPILAGLAAMGLSVFFLSSFGAGASPVLVSAGMLAAGIGFAFVNSPTNNAGAEALPKEEVGVGMGIVQGAFFLGAGTGPAIVGAFLAAHQGAASGALNPLYSLHAAPFSDAFLLVAFALLLALIAALRLPGNTKRDEESEQQVRRGEAG